VPIVFLAHQDQAGTGATTIAVVRARTVAIVETEPISAPTQRARPVLICEIAGFNPETRQYLAPTPAGALDRLAGHQATLRGCDLARCCASESRRASPSTATLG